MYKTLIALATLAGLAGMPALQAQHQMADSSRAGHHMAMMMQHHSVATVDLLVSHRDSLKLTDDQLKKLAELREHLAQAGGHAMHGSGRGTGMMMGQGMGMGMGHAMPQRARIAFDRVPGKMVPRVHRTAAEHCPMCPFAILNQAQRERAHQLLDQHQGHQHQG
jgi:hypothetical protein